MCFPHRLSRSSNRGPRSRGSLSPSRCCALGSGFSVTFCLAASPTRLVSIHHTSSLSRVAFWEPSAVQRLRRKFLTVRLTEPWPPIRRSVRGLHRASFPVHLHKRIPQAVFLRSQSRRYRVENFMRHTLWSGVLAWNTNWELREASTHSTLAPAR